MARVILVGTGRMGALIRSELEGDAELEVVGAYDVGNAADLDEVAPAADLVIDFSNRSALPHVEAYVRRTGAALVSGTTGFDADDLARLRSLGALAPVVHSGNYSLGVAVLRHLVAQAVAALPDWDVEIVETHHNQKVDAPSGTAAMLRMAVDPEASRDVAYGRQGMTGARPKGQIGMHSLRGGTVAGVHDVHLFGPDEELCLSHRASSRLIFVRGAIAAARRLLGRKPGAYDLDGLMFD